MLYLPTKINNIFVKLPGKGWSLVRSNVLLSNKTPFMHCSIPNCYLQYGQNAISLSFSRYHFLAEAAFSLVCARFSACFVRGKINLKFPLVFDNKRGGLVVI